MPLPFSQRELSTPRKPLCSCARVSILFAAIYVYNSAEFLELLVSQPLKRKTIWLSLFTGLALSLCIAFFMGAGIPILIYQANMIGITMIIMGLLLTVIFVAIAMLATVKTRDKAKGIGGAMNWLSSNQFNFVLNI